jgi:Flp pilus assembly protein TadD
VAEQLGFSSKLNRILHATWASGVKRRIFILSVLTAMVVGLYLNSLGNDFVNWDDPGLITGNSQVHSLAWSNIKEIFTLRHASTYQPIRVLSYAVDYHFWKLNPFGYHVTNIVFYLLTCIMVFFAAWELLGFLRAEKPTESNGRIAFFAALLFAAHPVHVEAVTWLAARKEVVLGFFFFASLYCYVRGARASDRTAKTGLYGLAFLCFVLAAFSKPVAVVLPGVILLFELSRGWKDFLRLLRKPVWLIPAILVSSILVIILIKVMIEADGIYPYRGGSFLSNFLMAFRLFIMNIKLMGLTVNYSPIYILTLPHKIFGPGTLLFVAVNSGLIILAIFMFKKNRVVFFGIMWFYITMLPFSNIIPISTPLADRYVFLASFAYCLLLALGFERLWAVTSARLSKDFFPFMTTVVLVFLLAGYGYMTVRQNRIWKDSFTLWSETLARNPKNPVAMNGLAVLFLDKDMNENALELLEKAVQISPLDYLAHNNIGVVYERMGQYEQSEYHYRTSLALKPDYRNPRANLGTLSARKGDFERGINILSSLVAEYPGDPTLHYKLAYAFDKAGKLDEAIRELERSIKLAPHSIGFYEKLGRLYLNKLNDREKALYFFRKGVEMAPLSKRREKLEAEIQRLSAEEVSLKEPQPQVGREIRE